MAKLRRKCEWCGKVKTVKYRWGTTNVECFCSEECALKWFCGVSETKCCRCGKTLCDGNIVYRHSNSSDVYCSAKCFLADRDCVPIEEVNKENNHEVD